jgi:hypothetical protein
LSGQKTSSVGSEQDREPDDFFWLAEAAHGGAHQQFFAARGAHDQAFVEFGGEDAGGNGVDADAILRPFAGEAAGESEDRGFGGGVGSYFVEAYEGSERAEVDDASVASRLEWLIEGLAGSEGAIEVCVEQ